MEEQNIRMAIDRHWAASAAGDQLPNMKSTTMTSCASIHNQARYAVGVTCRRFVVIILAGHRGFRSAGSWERAISGSPST